MWVRGTAGWTDKEGMTKVLGIPGLWAALPSLMGIDLCRTTQETPPQLCWAWHCSSAAHHHRVAWWRKVHSHLVCFPGTCREPFFLCRPTGRERITLFEKWSHLIPSHISIGAVHAGPRWYQSNVISDRHGQRRTAPIIHSLFREMAPKNLIFTD